MFPSLICTYIYSIDATTDKRPVNMGRMMNHSKVSPNIKPQLVEIDDEPHICFFAKKCIQPGDELLYDYGDHSAAAAKAHPWLQL